MPLEVRKLIRRMRGGAQAHLVEAEDGHFYVAKFQRNPQHQRILANELIASVLLEHLKIAAPPATILEVSREFLERNPEACFQLGAQRVPIQPGWHFGSRYPGDPARLAVYDFLPDVLLGQVANGFDFLGVLAFDKWTANSDGRQAIFFRTRVKDWVPRSGLHTVKLGLVGSMIDHGFLFNGPHWDFPDSPLQGLYPRRIVYRQVRSMEDFEPWLSQIEHFPEAVVDDAYKRVPREWLNGDAGQLEALFEKLMRRRRRVRALLEEIRDRQPAIFPEWR
jgi:hypothetical protein